MIHCVRMSEKEKIEIQKNDEMVAKSAVFSSFSALSNFVWIVKELACKLLEA